MERHLSTYPGVASDNAVTCTVLGGFGKVSIAEASKGMKGYERIEHVPKSSFRDTSMCIIIPTREPHLQIPFVQKLQSIMWPMNQRRFMFFVSGAEVGLAYDEQLKGILAHPELASCRYLLTIEDDMLIPGDAVLKLCESIEVGPFDAVGGFYFTRGDYNMPQIYGDPAEYARTGRLEFRPLDPTPALASGNAIVECNGIAMGCSLYRMELFRKVSGPWFQTLNEHGVGSMTQDLFFCRKAKLESAARFAVDTRVRCGHIDWKTGEVF